MNGGITSIESLGIATALIEVIDGGGEELQKCHGCGEVKPDVDVWATNPDTGEEVMLCWDCVES